MPNAVGHSWGQGSGSGAIAQAVALSLCKSLALSPATGVFEECIFREQKPVPLVNSLPKEPFLGPPFLTRKGAEKASFSQTVLRKGVFGQSILSSALLKCALKL